MIIYDRDFSQRLRNDFFDDLKVSQQLTMARYEQRSFFIRFKEGIARLIGPML